MATLVLPGQPLSTPGTAAQLAPGPGTYTRGGQVYAALVGKLSREGGVRRPALHLMLEDIKVDRDARPQIVSVKGKEETQAIPEPNATVIGTVSRITRQAATISLLTVDGRPCRPDFTGIIRSQDVRQTAKDSVKVRDGFTDFLSTAANSLGVLFAVSSTTGEALEAVSWEEMREPSTGEVEPRKVAGPE
ncbi:hypothetical protein Rhopal_002568-T1 [Rhodotorula paludigena]|uniref:Exosome complex component N-terminal domain-containing protein n=1 Tax=Rhodotorula paludigena TaxID=86838 RepID=A0AAV5GAF3_9BASI|nr:hypothetical protein Rhopal_002568-T1 [Rhodotorula paludigena]